MWVRIPPRALERRTIPPSGPSHLAYESCVLTDLAQSTIPLGACRELAIVPARSRRSEREHSAGHVCACPLPIWGWRTVLIATVLIETARLGRLTLVASLSGPGAVLIVRSVRGVRSAVRVTTTESSGLLRVSVVLLSPS
jgi:hypothetical protein